jgi:hypothetical protein
MVANYRTHNHPEVEAWLARHPGSPFPLAREVNGIQGCGAPSLSRRTSMGAVCEGCAKNATGG